MEWRKRLDPIKLFAALGVLLFAALIWWFAGHTPPSDELIPLPPPRVDPDPGTAPTLEDAGVALDAEPDPISTKRPRTRRGKLVQRELERKRLAQAGDPGGGAGDGVNVVLSGADVANQRAFARKLKGVSVSSSMTRGFLVTLKVQSGGSSESAWVKCSATISELPQKKLASALSSHAEAAGEGTDRDELIRDASEACMSALGQDVSAWIRAHR